MRYESNVSLFLIFSGSFPRDPIANVSGTVPQAHARLLAVTQEHHRFLACDTQIEQIKHYVCWIAYGGARVFQFRQSIRLDSTADFQYNCVAIADSLQFPHVIVCLSSIASSVAASQ